MYGEKRELVVRQCCVCLKHVALRVDKEDLDRHEKDGIFVQHAFVDRNGKSYLSEIEREIFPGCSGCCPGCYGLLCPSDPLAYC